MPHRATLLCVGLSLFFGCARTAGSRAEAELHGVSDPALTGRVHLEKGRAGTDLTVDIDGRVPELVSVALVRESCEDLRARIAGPRTSADAREAVVPLPHQHLGTLTFPADRTKAELKVPDDTLIQRATVAEQTLVLYRGKSGTEYLAKPVLACADVR